MNILITGGAGFIASHIAERLIKEGHKVIIIDDLSTGRRENIPSDATFIELDISSSELEKVFKEYKFDAVNHHAAQLDVRKSVADPLYDTRVNVLGMVNLLENCACYGVAKFIYASSGGVVYGEQEIFPAPETHPHHPLSPYGVAKLAGEHYLYYYWKTYNIRYVALRYANVYGPRQNPFGEAGVVAIFSHKMLRNEPIIINGDGKQTRDYTYVGDVTDMNIEALKYLEDNETGIFNVATGIETDVNQLFYILKDLTGADVIEKHAPAKEGEQLRSVLDISLVKEVLNWSPKVNIIEGLKNTVEYFRNSIRKSKK